MFNSFCKICIIIIDMHFTNARAMKHTNTNISRVENTMMFTNKRIMQLPLQTMNVHPPPPSINTNKTYEEKVTIIQDGKKMKWGEPFWFLFHVLAEKVRETEFPRLRVGLLSLVVTICSNLPCPDCTMHAKNYLNGINFNVIITKDDFKNMVYNFHNTVNARKKYPIYPKEQLDKYKNGNLIPIIENFMHHFLANHKSFHLIADDIQRRRISDGVKKWFQENIKYFY